MIHGKKRKRKLPLKVSIVRTHPVVVFPPLEEV
jgi:hypothetical protein